MTPTLSLIVLAWENLSLTERCIMSLRAGTTGDHELVIVDNGSGPEAAAFAGDAADVPVLNPENVGFAAGMNSGLRVASGRYIAFINNDTVFPEGWDSDILEHLADPSVGIVAPAVTVAGNPVTVRNEPSTEVIRLLPFGEFPSGVVYVMPRETATALGGWNEDYPVASSEDLDLCFTVWANGLDIVLDTRVLIDHVSQASVRHLPARGKLYADNLDRFLARWRSENPEVPRLPGVTTEELERNLDRARTAVRWIERMIEARRDAADARRELANLRDQMAAPPASRRPRWLRRP